MKKILFIAAAALFGLTACTEDYKDWIPQTQPTQPEVVSFGNGTISTVATADLNALPEGQELVQVCSIEAPTATDEAYTPRYVITVGEQSFDLDDQGRMKAEDLQALLSATYGRRPVERDLQATVTMFLNDGTTEVFVATSDPFTIKAIPEAPVIEQAYYLTGTINGWDNKNTDYKLTNDGSDPYENPVFKLRIPAPEDGSNVEFKMTPESGVGGDWSGCLAAIGTGMFNYDNVGDNFVITADPDALYYDLTFNMLDQTWVAVPVGFNEFIYEIGNESGWSEVHPLHGNGLGQYEAIIRLDGEFKFKPNKDNWDGDWEKASGDATAGTLTADGGPNIDAVEAGFYFVQVDLKEMTYKITPVSSLSIIGSVRGSWDTDIDMTYNDVLNCWEARETLTAGEFKFRLNHDWAINWGGELENLSQGGANLTLPADGPYIIRLYLSDEAPGHCTIKADSGYPDNIYEIGNESSWGASHLLLGNGSGQYSGYYYLNGEFKFKPNRDNWDDDFEKVSGDAYAGTLTTGGGPNIDGPEAGVYKIDVDLTAMTYQLTAITSVSIIGSVQGNWDTDVDLTYNVEAGCWETTAELNAGEWKFRANHDWAINWGGSESNLTQDGSNLQLAEAGTYKVQLFLSYAGAHHCSVTKQ